jgi:hypothetical protein
MFLPFVTVGCLIACGSNSSQSDFQETMETLPAVSISKKDTVIDFENSDLGKMADGFKAGNFGFEEGSGAACPQKSVGQ